jgi:hypothetical protein
MNTYCAIYVATDINPDTLKTELAELFNRKLANYEAISLKEKCSVDIVKNAGYSAFLQSEFPDGFLYFRYKIDITFDDDIDIEYCIQIVTIILNFLWARKIPCVAAADYERRLPLNGGYKSTVIPWPGNISN